jgi:hypothetical protein
MSFSDQDAAVGRLVRRRTELRREHAALASDVQIAGRTLAELGNMLADFDASRQDYDAVTAEAQRYSQVPDAARVLRMLQELVDPNRQIAATDAQAHILGID